MSKSQASTEALQKRSCRCCNRSYDYPVPKHRATRFHCADCATLKPDLRKVFEGLNRRIKRLESGLAKLKKDDA
jgi:hypothetical protein